MCVEPHICQQMVELDWRVKRDMTTERKICVIGHHEPHEKQSGKTAKQPHCHPSTRYHQQNKYTYVLVEFQHPCSSHEMVGTRDYRENQNYKNFRTGILAVTSKLTPTTKTRILVQPGADSLCDQCPPSN